MILQSVLSTLSLGISWAADLLLQRVVRCSKELGGPLKAGTVLGDPLMQPERKEEPKKDPGVAYPDCICSNLFL